MTRDTTADHGDDGDREAVGSRDADRDSDSEGDGDREAVGTRDADRDSDDDGDCETVGSRDADRDSDDDGDRETVRTRDVDRDSDGDGDRETVGTRDVDRDSDSERVGGSPSDSESERDGEVVVVEVGGVRVRGVAVDGETRCAHYDTPRDVVAIAFACCERFFPCHACHAAATAHEPTRWARREFGERAVLCGACGDRLSIETYLDSGPACPTCGHAFNPGCRAHADRYFDV